MIYCAITITRQRSDEPVEGDLMNFVREVASTVWQVRILVLTRALQKSTRIYGIHEGRRIHHFTRVQP